MAPVLVLVVAACADDSDSASDSASDSGSDPASDADEQAGGWLLILTGEPGTAADGTLTLALGEGGSTTMFTDRPEREVGLAPVEDLVREWTGEFQGDPPNASLVTTTEGGANVAVVTLAAPSLEDGELRFGYESLAHPEPPREFGSFSLFVDMIDPEFGLRPARTIVDDEAVAIDQLESESYEVQGFATVSFDGPSDSFAVENTGSVTLQVQSRALKPGDSRHLSDEEGVKIHVANGTDQTGRFEVTDG